MPGTKKGKLVRKVRKSQIDDSELENILNQNQHIQTTDTDKSIPISDPDPVHGEIDKMIEKSIIDNLKRTNRYDAAITDIFAGMPVSQDNHGVNTVVLKKLTPAEERRLKHDIKRGTMNQSTVLIDMLKRCPNLENTIQDILNKKVTLNEPKSNQTVSQKVSVPVKRKTKHNVESERIKKSKKPRYDCKIKYLIEDLGSEDTDSGDTESEDCDYSDKGEDIDMYQEDDFVTYDSESDQILGSDSNETEGSDLEAELNDLHNDYITSRTRAKANPSITREMLSDINKNINEIRNIYLDSKIDISKVMLAKFNKEDSVWFYKNIKRVPLMEGREKFDLEDKIEKRYKLLKSLQEANMYEKFNACMDDRDTTRDILASKHSARVQHVLLNKMYTVSNESIEEYQKALNWMDTILSLPTEVKSSRHDVSGAVKRLYEKLQQNLYGMDDVIVQILQAVCSILSDPKNESYILTLVGPPGVGKTTISTLIAEAIGMGFGQVSCGSIADQATIVGHGSTYIGSKPGVFTQCLINNQQLDNVILLDEMDKMYDSKMLPVLLHVLDRSQNNRFKDAFCPEVDVDLSKNLYIVAVNSLDSFDNALRDRMKIVHVNGYDVVQKTVICTKHIIPRLIEKTGIDATIDPQVVAQCINTVSPDNSGVRDLERFFGDVYEKLLLDKHMEGKVYNLSAKKIDMDIIYQLCLKNL